VTELTDHTTSEPRGPRLSDLSRGGSGTLPVTLVPWQLIVARRRIASRAQDSDNFSKIALAMVLTAMFMVNLTVTAITIAVPRISGDFDVSQATILWAVTGPILVSAVLGPTFGKLGDQRGHRFMFGAGLLVNAVFTLAIALSWSGTSFVTFRLLAAVGGAAIGPSALAFINRLFAPEDRASALGWWSFVGAGSPVIGVVAGGFIIDAVGWRPLFAVQAPLLLVALVMALTVLPETTRQPPAPFDIKGAFTLAVGTGLGLIAVTTAGSDGFTARVLLLAIGAVVMLAAFAGIEKRVEAPLIPPRYWKLRGFIAPTLTMALVFAAYMGSFVLTPLMLQSPAYGFTAAAAGTVTIARPLMFSLFGPLSGWLSNRVGERALAGFGSLCVVVSMLGLSRFSPGQSLIWVVIPLGLAGIGMGAASPSLTATVANSVADEDLGVAGAAQQMLQQVGLVLGIQALSAIQAATVSGGVARSYHLAFGVGAAVALVGAAVSTMVPTAVSADPAAAET
jgi:MFS family permease